MTRKAAFTLVELLASLALVALLVVGINQVFSIATRATGAGQAMSTANRDNRSAQSVFFADMQNVALADSPFFIIRNQRVSAFRNEADRLSDLNYSGGPDLPAVDRQVRTVDADANNTEEDPFDEQPVTNLTARNHRVDQIQYFARGLFRRKTGNDGVFVSGIASTEAYVSVGHLRQPTDLTGLNTAGARDPGIRHANSLQGLGDNPNNFYAQQWLLGKSVFVLKETDRPPGGGTTQTIMEGTVPQFYILRRAADFDSAVSTALTPFSEGASWSNNGTGAPGSNAVQFSRYDLMGISMSQAVQEVSKAIENRNSYPLGGDQHWFDTVNYRFAGWQYPTKPHSSFGLARTAPVLLAGCTQFVVEYAGDFVTQEEAVGATEGAVIGIVPDGITDYVAIDNGGGNRPTRRTRWYGFPRNVDTSDDTDAGAPSGVRIRGTGGRPGALDFVDVVPLRDVLQTVAGFTQSAPFERGLNPADTPTQNREGYSGLAPVLNYAAPSATPPNAYYVCAWGPAGTFTNWAGAPVPDPPYPRMLRFVIGIDDQQGRLADAQLYEYVVELPGNG